jgi:Tfp pilus assembly protein PilF
MVNNLGLMLRDKGDLAAARVLLERALSIREATLPPGDPDLARALNNLGVVVHEQGDVPAAASLYKRALAIAEPALGARHPLVGQIVATSPRRISSGQFAEAEPLYDRRWPARPR